jgi:hypothetical protein
VIGSAKLAADYNGGVAAGEDLMSAKFPVPNRLAVLLAAAAIAAAGFGLTAAVAAPKSQLDERGRPYYGPHGPNVSYQQGPHTRIFVTKRSWLDAGVEVLPGDRKFTDYAFPPGAPFGTMINNRSIEREPLNPHSDMGGPPTRFPLY